MSANTKLTPAIPRLNRNAILLALATLITLGVGEEGLGGWAIMALLLGLALFKGRLIVLDFMGLRRTAPLWRRLVLGWLRAKAVLDIIKDMDHHRTPEILTAEVISHIE